MTNQRDSETLGERLLAAVRRLICGLRGHDRMLQFEPDRMSLRCVSCGHETVGWAMTLPPPTVTARGYRWRHRIQRPWAIRRVA